MNQRTACSLVVSIREIKVCTGEVYRRHRSACSGTKQDGFMWNAAIKDLGTIWVHQVGQPYEHGCQGKAPDVGQKCTYCVMRQPFPEGSPQAHAPATLTVLISKLAEMAGSTSLSPYNLPNLEGLSNQPTPFEITSPLPLCPKQARWDRRHLLWSWDCAPSAKRRNSHSVRSLSASKMFLRSGIPP